MKIIGLAFAHINYGQRTEKRELKAFNDIADYFRIKKRLVIDYTHLSKIGGSSLTDKNISVTQANLNSKDSSELRTCRSGMQIFYLPV